MKKSTLVMILCLVLAVALGVGGTLAYLTDSDGDVNVMTVGYVTITQNEQERVEIGNPDAGIDEFTQNKAMNPAVVKDHSSKETIDANGWDVEIRDQVKNYVDKIVSVTNTGANDAYVRTIYAIPEVEGFDTTYNASEQWLHWNGVSDTDTTPNNGWFWGTEESGKEWPGNTDNWNVVENVEIEGKLYDIYIATNVDVLAPGKTTAPSLLGMFIDERVDCKVDPATGEKNYTFGTYDLGDISTLNVLVLSQAVQADGFETAWEAFDSAFPTTEENLVEWLSNIEQGTPGDKNDTNNPPVFKITVYTADELNGALGSYNEITLGDSITAETYNIDENVAADIMLNSNTMNGTIMNNGDVTISGGNIENNAVGIENYGTATLEDVVINAGSTADYAVILGAGSETTLNNVDIDSAGGGVGAVDGAQVVFNGGSVAVNTASTSGRYNFYVVGEGTVVTIEDGTFSFSKTLNQKRAYIYAGSGATVYVKGGTFGPASARSGYTAGILGDGDIIITGGTFGFDPSAWVADGYQAVKDGTTWTVSAIN